MPGSGSMTPITLPVVGESGIRAYPLARTHLSLVRWARIMGINPIHFMSGSVDGLFDPHINCSKVWTRHTWQQTDQASHEDLALSIAEAERTISEYMNWNVAPQWTVEEEYGLPRGIGSYSSLGYNFLNQRSAIVLRRGRLVAPGRRGLTLVESSAPVILSDPDGDGFNELATITVTTSVTDKRELKVYHQGREGDPRWEIRPMDSIVISGGTATIKAGSWLFADPNEQARFPGVNGWQPLDFSDAATIVDSVDVYREFNDTSVVTAQFAWEQNDCGSDTVVTQDGYASTRAALDGIAYMVPGTSGSPIAYSIARKPDRVSVSYYSGHRSDDYLSSYSTEPLDDNIAQAIAYMATARLEREICECNNGFIKSMQEDLVFASGQQNFVAISEVIATAPFGSRRGEWLAWLAIKNMVRYIPVAIV